MHDEQIPSASGHITTPEGVVPVCCGSHSISVDIPRVLKATLVYAGRRLALSAGKHIQRICPRYCRECKEETKC